MELPRLAPADAAGSRPVLPVRPDRLDDALAAFPPAARAWAAACGFAAAAGRVLLVPGGEGIAAALFGLGEERDPHVFGALPGGLPDGGGAWRIDPAALAASGFSPDDALFGWCAGAGTGKGATLVPPPDAALGADMAVVLLAGRRLVDAPANRLGPAELADAAGALAAQHGAAFRRVEGAALARDYPLVDAVGRGSARTPVVAHLAWRGSGATDASPLVALVGKGVCFDSGGLDLKTAAGMKLMRKDMGGAATVLAVAELAMRRDLPLRLAVSVGCVENMTGPAAMRPGDVVRGRSGVAVEINNTDAEGRLVLADLLAEAAEARPDLLVDVATLTGAARVALGPDLPALFTDDEALAATLARIGAEHHDPLWRLPLWRGYDAWLETRGADLSNVSAQPTAGAITAALFLRRFVPVGISWAHLDSYCWNDRARPGRPEGGEIPLLRVLFGALTNLCERGMSPCRAARQVK